MIKVFDSELLEIVIDATFAVADEIVEEEAMHHLEDMKNQLSGRGMSLEQYLEMLNMTNEALMEKLKEEALRNLKAAFTLMKVAEVEKLVVSEEDVNKAYEDIAKMYGMSVEDIKKALGNRSEGLKRDLLNQKVVDFLKKENNL